MEKDHLLGGVVAFFLMLRGQRFGFPPRESPVARKNSDIRASTMFTLS